MRTIKFLLRKEFLQIFRNRAMLPILFVMPIIQLLVLSFAATYELKEVDFALIDMDQSSLSRELTAKFQATGYFNLELETFDESEAQESMNAGDIKMILRIPPDFENQLSSGKQADLQLIIDAVDGSTAGLIQSYSSSILNDLNASKLAELRIESPSQQTQQAKAINIIPQNWYNPDLDYITYMVPGILVVLVSMIGIFLSGMNIVREYEIGTIEQLNVTPIQKYQFMIGKLLPFWVIGMFDLLIGLALARFGFQIPFLGSLTTILVVAGIYLVVLQSLGLLISTLTHTQQQAMFIAWFIMVIFILMGGLFTPIESMPQWAQNLTLANPIAYFIKIMRMVLLKGAGWKEIQFMVYALAAMGSGLLWISINRYKKTTA
ncbi:MAG: ABC transporter permease [Balneola sp.]|jgi:ABC-2 type transport system permease protein|nr:ABC transporter permease [Balneola sp.]MBE80165.1 ABC transporter permease [Balneola sp.]HBX64722.1 ABC transporter permease [Balneolaceae bacterium]|tara:strand:+ start:276 stop:1406 length:1131 start_codon:yes stop_codon:yes gene_type:complete